ncbi:glucose-6-phosphate dehydrogenase 4 [Striga asiatica]|uniref:Glucose-6-phosphate dehydrogenase 4 n=1 Tax=Striga asiatica TaxID=4170 RepID=A0A5A7PZC2_STRAF|nr:glucose-6-phosphate dehydrogenase 4 [Striga asiatica]
MDPFMNSIHIDWLCGRQVFYPHRSWLSSSSSIASKEVSFCGTFFMTWIPSAALLKIAFVTFLKTGLREEVEVNGTDNSIPGKQPSNKIRVVYDQTMNLFMLIDENRESKLLEQCSSTPC